jgi:tripartite-type tricarboxylate transporter receptor subunit TctC
VRFIRLAALLLALLPGLGMAQPWPSRSIRLIVPYPPGGSTDVAARVIADKLSAAIGQPVVVENRAGAGGALGTLEVSRAQPDGYTILLAANQVSTMHLVMKDIQYDLLRDFEPITQVSTQPNALAVNTSLGVKDVKELVARARKKPATLFYAHPGPGSAQQMTAELLWRAAGVQVTGVPYKGGGQAVIDLIANHVPIALLGITPLIPYHKAGQIRIIAVTSKERFPILPDIPTLGEAGYKDVDSIQWLGLLAPKGTARAIVDRLHVETAKILAQPDVREHFAQAGLVPVGNTPAQFGNVIRLEDERWTRVAHELGVQPQ